MTIVLLLLISGALWASENPNPLKAIVDQIIEGEELIKETEENGKEEEQGEPSSPGSSPLKLAAYLQATAPSPESPNSPNLSTVKKNISFDLSFSNEQLTTEQVSSPGLSPIIKKSEDSSPFLKKTILPYSTKEKSIFKYWLPYIKQAKETEIINYNNHILAVDGKENAAHMLPSSFFLLEARNQKELQPLIDQLHEAALLLHKNEKKDKKNLFIAKLSLLLKNIHEANNDQVEPASKLFRQGFLYHKMQDLIIQCNQQPTNLNLAKLCSGVKKIVLPVPPQVDWHKAAQDIRTV